MKTTRPIIVALCLLLLLGLLGCQTARIAISAEPEDAKIYVDGEYLGKGVVSYDAGNEYGFPRQLQVDIRHPDYESFSTAIKTRLDWGPAILASGLNLVVGAVLFGSYLSGNDQIGYIGIINLALSPVPFLTYWKYQKKGYSYELDPK